MATEANNYSERIPRVLLIKFLDSIYEKNFRMGKLYMNPIKYFQIVEEEKLSKVRRDETDGVTASFDAKKATLEINGCQVNGLRGRINFFPPHIENINIFCMTGLSTREIISPNKKILFSDKFKTFGDKAILIKPDCVPEFMSRIRTAIYKRKYLYACPGEPYIFTHVDYEKDDYNGSMGVFKKFNNFQWQREWRIALYRHTKKPSSKPLILSIGSINELCMTIDTEQLVNNGFDLIYH